MQFNFAKVFAYWPEMMPALGLTLLLTVLSVFFGTVFGGVLALQKLQKNKIIKGLAVLYTSIIRCTPSIVLLFLVFYGLPLIFMAAFGIDLNQIARAAFVIITMSLMFAASISEVFRSAYEAIPKGQYEAALCAGLTRFKAFKRIMLPQMMAIALPNILNSTIGILKEGALAFTIGVFDLTGKANLIVSLNMGAHTREIYIGVAIIYWILVMIITQIQHAAEKRLNKHKRTAAPDIKVLKPAVDKE